MLPLRAVRRLSPVASIGRVVQAALPLATTFRRGKPAGGGAVGEAGSAAAGGGAGDGVSRPAWLLDLCELLEAGCPWQLNRELRAALC